MRKNFLFSSTVLFLGGALLLLSGLLSGSAFLLALSTLFLLMGGIPLLYVWFKEMLYLLSEEHKAADSSDPNRKQTHS